jgi:hypothetical protein
MDKENKIDIYILMYIYTHTHTYDGILLRH